MTSDRSKKKPPKDTTMPAGQWTGEKCPECGSRLVTDGSLVWCMRRDAETQRCLFVRVR